MSDMKCPFCQQELRKIHPTYVICDNCRITGEDKLWQELIKLVEENDRTRKELDVAVNALKRIADAPIGYCMFAERALEQITALEQKDVK